MYYLRVYITILEIKDMLDGKKGFVPRMIKKLIFFDFAQLQLMIEITLLLTGC